MDNFFIDANGQKVRTGDLCMVVYNNKLYKQIYLYECSTTYKFGISISGESLPSTSTNRGWSTRFVRKTLANNMVYKIASYGEYNITKS